MKLHKKSIYLIICMLVNVAITFGNNPNKCTTADILKKHIVNNQNTLLKKQILENKIQQWILNNENNKLNSNQAITTIPIVVHVVYNNSTQNISDNQILTQITVLNKDFRNLNADRLSSTHPYFNLAADANFEFCLAKIDPNGNTTTGITRTSTSETEFDGNPNASSDEKIKFTINGGFNNWNPSQYLNIWICKLNGGTLGYAQFPSEFNDSPETDGVVIDYRYFGTIGTVSSPYNLGRTATHEIGHWLNLNHIWGDENCGDDEVNDTPTQQSDNFGCPNFPQITCANGPNGDLFMDYMDYTDDGCMAMFTIGQVARMTAALNVARATIKTANKCATTTGIAQQKTDQIKIYPNPIQNYLTIEGVPQTKNRLYSINIFNILGEKIFSNNIETSQTQIEMLGFRTGTYVINIFNDEFTYTQKLVVVK